MTPENCFNFVAHHAPKAAEDLQRAIADGIPADTIADSFDPDIPENIRDFLHMAVVGAASNSIQQ